MRDKIIIIIAGEGVGGYYYFLTTYGLWTAMCPAIVFISVLFFLGVFPFRFRFSLFIPSVILQRCRICYCRVTLGLSREL